MKTRTRIKRVAFIGVSIALAMVFSYLESQVFPSNSHFRVGLPNLVVMVVLYKVGWKETVLVSILRIFLMFACGFARDVTGLVLSLAGAALSLTGIILLKKTKWFSPIAVSIVGGVLHNIGQIIAVCIWYQTPGFVLELPFLLITGTIAGAVIGLVAGMLVKRLEKFKF